MVCRGLNYEYFQPASLSLYLLQKNFAILSSPQRKEVKFQSTFTRVSLEAENATSFKQKSESSPHLKVDGSATLSE